MATSKSNFYKLIAACFCLTAAFVLCLSCAPGTTQEQPSGDTIQTGVMDQMVSTSTDQVTLATDVYSATGSGPWPVIFNRTPYDRKDSFNADRGTTFGDAGVIYFVQNARGQYGSNGTSDFFGSDRLDGTYMLNLVAAQSWCNGRIGILGNSAPGIMGYLVLPGAPAAVQCAWIEVATGDVYQAVYPGGVFRQYLITEWLSATNQSHMLPDLETNALDGSWWDVRQPIEQVSQYPFPPTVHVTGWYDIFTADQIAMFEAIQAAGATQQHLIIGPWSHNTLGEATTGELTFPNGTMDLNTMMEDWFSYYLLDVQNDVADWPAVQYFVMGDVDSAGAPGNEWRTATTWPPFTATDRTFYLRIGGTLDETQPGAAEGADAYTYDPADPVPTTGGNNMLLNDGPYDQSTLEARSDVLTYATAALTSPIEATGTIRATIWIQTDVVDTDVSVRVSDVYPDGRSMLITEGILRTRFRNGSFSSETLMTPNTPTQINVDLWPTSIVFNAGHRIGVAVTSSNSPRFAPNPNTGAAFQLSDSTIQAANVEILHNAQYPSAIVLPTNP